MANEEQLAILRQGVGIWNAWRETNSESKVNLMGADLREADLIKANLRGANLSRANLREADLSRADLIKANLREADLREADLSGADLSGADLSGADLSGADLSGADLSMADLSMADLSWTNLNNVELYHTIFVKNNLSTVRGLDAVLHNGPSTIGIDTLYRSGGKIPEVFLRGCGVPESLIEYLPSLLGAMQPIQFYSCFISYSTKDHEFAQRLYERMQSHGLRVWFAPEELKGGHKLDDQIDHAIRKYDKLILVLSDHSLQSAWVNKEVRKARREELTSNRRKLFPIRLVDMDAINAWWCTDHEINHDVADEVRQYFIPDFSHWKDHDSFEREFKKLLYALKAVNEPPMPSLPAKIL